MMRPCLTFRLHLLFIGCVSFALNSAHAELPDVIYVSADDLNKAGEITLGLHVNSTPHGAYAVPSYSGEVVTDHHVRFTPELYYGVRDNLQLSVSVPTVISTHSSDTGLAGAHATLTWMYGGRNWRDSHWFGGASTSILSTREKYEYGRTLVDAGLIGGYHTASLLLAANLNATSTVQPGYSHAPDYSLALKATHLIGNAVSAGGEYYLTQGKNDADTVSKTILSHTLFAVFDIDLAKSAFHVGIGRGLNSRSDRWTLTSSYFIPI